jgi:hypothetical protein
MQLLVYVDFRMKKNIERKKDSIIWVGKFMLPLILKYGNLCLNASLVSKETLHHIDATWNLAKFADYQQIEMHFIVLQFLKKHIVHMESIDLCVWVSILSWWLQKFSHNCMYPNWIL